MESKSPTPAKESKMTAVSFQPTKQATDAFRPPQKVNNKRREKETTTDTDEANETVVLDEEGTEVESIQSSSHEDSDVEEFLKTGSSTSKPADTH